MNALKKLAAFYSKFWYRTAANTWAVSDNAPSEFVIFLQGVPRTTDRAVIHEALRSLANPEPASAPETLALLGWFAAHPSAIAQCDALMISRQPPRTLTTLLRNAYLAEVSAATNLVRTFLQAELDKY